MGRTGGVVRAARPEGAHRRWRAAAWLASALILSACGGSADEPLRIVLVTLDTLRADGLSAMPRTRAFAQGGVVFRRAYAATSTTQPTHASLFTGLHPWEHGVTRNGMVLGDQATTLAEALSRAGFETAGIAASFPLERRFGFAQGFDRYHDAFDEPYVRRWEGRELEEGRFYSLCDAVTDRALEELDRMEGGRQFLWIHYFDPHDPYGDTAGEEPLGITALLHAAATSPEAAPSLVARAHELYLRDLAALDASLERVFERLEGDPVPTHWFLTSDHGESFGELGCLGHGKRLTPEQVHVPLVYRGPAAPPGVREDECGSVDVTATILELAGVSSAGTRGRDLLAAPPSRPLALGMRRTFVQPKDELLVDGSRRPLAPQRFFLARDGSLVCGDGSDLVEGDDPARPYQGSDRPSILRSFRALERLLRSGEGKELTDPEVQRALSALGYGR